MTEQVRGMGLFLGGHHRLICIVLSLCKHACKSVCDERKKYFGVRCTLIELEKVLEPYAVKYISGLV